MIPAVLVTATAACGRTGVVASGPIQLDSTPRQIAFAEPLPTFAVPRELCLEFHPPGGSLRVSAIRVVLVTTTGERVSWDSPAIDRSGEATVCLVDRRDPSGPRPESSADGARRYRGVELSSDVPLSVREIRWRTRED